MKLSAGFPKYCSMKILCEAIQPHKRPHQAQGISSLDQFTKKGGGGEGRLKISNITSFRISLEFTMIFYYQYTYNYIHQYKTNKVTLYDSLFKMCIYKLFICGRQLAHSKKGNSLGSKSICSRQKKQKFLFKMLEICS